MIERERFWSAVDEALDARRDPWAEAQVQEWIADHPEDREELARLTRRLEAVASARPRAGRTFAPMIAAAAAVVLAVQLWAPEAKKDLPQPRPDSRVVSFSIEATLEHDGETTTVFTDADHTERSRVSKLGNTVIASRLESRFP